MGRFSQKHTCPECNEQFKKREELLNHGQTAHNLTIINCPRCNESFLYKKSRIEHMDGHKVNMKEQIGILLLGMIIPLVGIIPFAKIHKLGYGFLMGGGLFAILFIPLLIPQITEYADDSIVFAILFFVRFPVVFYFLIKWTMKWNKKIDIEIKELSKVE